MVLFMLASVASFAQRGRDRDERYDRDERHERYDRYDHDNRNNRNRRNDWDDRYDNRYRNSRGPVIVYQQRNPFYIGYETRFMPRDARMVMLNGCRHYAYNGYLYRELPRRNGLISFQITARL
jgi:hypothetical protein